MIVKVRAIRDGFYKGARRRAGTVFDISVEKIENLGKWMEPIGVSANVAGKAAPAKVAETAPAAPVKGAARVAGGKAAPAKTEVEDAGDLA